MKLGCYQNSYAFTKVNFYKKTKQKEVMGANLNWCVNNPTSYETEHIVQNNYYSRKDQNFRAMSKAEINH